MDAFLGNLLEEGSIKKRHKKDRNTVYQLHIISDQVKVALARKLTFLLCDKKSEY